MTIEAAIDFANKVNEEDSLQTELESATKDKEDVAAYQAVIEMGAKHGYNFTAEEAKEVREAILAEAEKLPEEELSEEDLEAVAGGCGYHGGRAMVRGRAVAFSGGRGGYGRGGGSRVVVARGWGRGGGRCW